MQDSNAKSEISNQATPHESAHEDSGTSVVNTVGRETTEDIKDLAEIEEQIEKIEKIEEIAKTEKIGKIEDEIKQIEEAEFTETVEDNATTSDGDSKKEEQVLSPTEVISSTEGKHDYAASAHPSSSTADAECQEISDEQKISEGQEMSDEQKIINLRNDVLTSSELAEATSPLLLKKLRLNKRVLEVNSFGTALPRYDDRYLYQGMINRCINQMVEDRASSAKTGSENIATDASDAAPAGDEGRRQGQ